jgi:capsular polysaccharide biosynthesis protein
MDLSVYFKVLWRFRILMGCGLLLAFSAALLSIARLDVDGGMPKLVYRSDEVWLSAATVFVTQSGFPSGRAVFDEFVRVETSEDSEATFVPRFGDVGRYSGLAELYAELAKSDDVQRAVLAGAPPSAVYEPEPARSPSGTVLPLIHMKGYGASPEIAAAIANRATDAFRTYLAEQQASNRIPQDKRVQVVEIRKATEAQIFEPRSIVRPMFIFLVMAMIFVALAFVLENLRPRVRQVPDVQPADHPARARRSA